MANSNYEYLDIVGICPTCKNHSDLFGVVINGKLHILTFECLACGIKLENKGVKNANIQR